MKMIPELCLWHDPQARCGPHNMAIDQWLLETAQVAILRVYHWEPGWGSFGVFGRLDQARSAFADGPALWVRRWTGGGVVDHRADWTYTLVIPRGTPGTPLRAAESYASIHAALAVAMATGGEALRMLDECGSGCSAACFSSPVAFDLIDPSGAKRAGAGQRRSRHGLLHQGSVIPGRADPLGLAAGLAGALAEVVRPVVFAPEPQQMGALARRYASAEWTQRR